MKTMMDRLQVEDDKLNLELEESHGDYEKMRLIFEKRIDLSPSSVQLYSPLSGGTCGRQQTYGMKSGVHAPVLVMR